MIHRSISRAVAILIVAVVAGCSASSAPPDEANEKYFPGKHATPEELAAAAKEHFPPAHFNYFKDMDCSGVDPSGNPIALNLDGDSDAIIGRNAWVIWAGGNEAFWDWLARHSYGSIDLLKLVDSQEARETVRTPRRYHGAGHGRSNRGADQGGTWHSLRPADRGPCRAQEPGSQSGGLWLSVGGRRSSAVPQSGIHRRRGGALEGGTRKGSRSLLQQRAFCGATGYDPAVPRRHVVWLLPHCPAPTQPAV